MDTGGWTNSGLDAGDTEEDDGSCIQWQLRFEVVNAGALQAKAFYNRQLITVR